MGAAPVFESPPPRRPAARLRARVTGIDVTAAVVLGATCGAVYLLVVAVLGPAIGESRESGEIGGMWAVVATIFVFRASVGEALKDAWSRLVATTISLALCLAYLLLLPVNPLGIAVVIAAGALLALLAGRAQDAPLTGITSIVVLVVADLGHPAPQWVQPLLRLLDTAVGVAVGLVVAAALIRITERTGGRHATGG